MWKFTPGACHFTSHILLNGILADYNHLANDATHENQSNKLKSYK